MVTVRYVVESLLDDVDADLVLEQVHRLVHEDLRHTEIKDVSIHVIKILRIPAIRIIGIT
jgi:hypothetical protein